MQTEILRSMNMTEVFGFHLLKSQNIYCATGKMSTTILCIHYGLCTGAHAAKYLTIQKIARAVTTKS